MIKELYGFVQRQKRKNKSWKIFYKTNKLIVNAIYPFVARLDGKYGVNNTSEVIVSLTTYPARIKTVWVTIATLMNQTYKPAKIVLYLSEEQFPGREKNLPRRLVRMQQRGLEIKFVEEDLKPHKKYLYAFMDFKDKMIVTVDDDIFYPEDHLERLVMAARKYPTAVICCRSHKIEFEDYEKEKFSPYNSWKNNVTDEPNLYTLPVGCNGVLYHPQQFDAELFNIDSIKKLALYTDDLWLKAMEIRNDIKGFNCSDEPLVYFDNIFTMNTGLWKVNTNENDNKNDLAWKRIVANYPEIKEKLIRSLEIK